MGVRFVWNLGTLLVVACLGACQIPKPRVKPPAKPFVLGDESLKRDNNATKKIIRNYRPDTDVVIANFLEIQKWNEQGLSPAERGRQIFAPCLAQSNLSAEFKFGEARCLDDRDVVVATKPIFAKHLQLGCATENVMRVSPRKPLEKLEFPTNCQSMQLELFQFNPRLRYLHTGKDE